MIVMCGNKVGINSDRFPITWDRIFKLSLIGQGITQVEVNAGVARIDFNRAAEILFGFHRVLLLTERSAKIDQYGEIVGLDYENALIDSDSRPDFPLLMALERLGERFINLQRQCPQIRCPGGRVPVDQISPRRRYLGKPSSLHV